jgi:tetratricopeptide (TPR) repeat protein
MNAEAQKLFQDAYQHQVRGELDEAIRLYLQSLSVQPSAEAHTFLGWTYSFKGDLEAAIVECKAAIAVDPEFGNPYNDIGAYLIELGRPDEAIPWLQKAMTASRYESPQFPHMNLGRVYETKGLHLEAAREYQEALAIEPGYSVAWRALGRVRAILN